MTIQSNPNPNQQSMPPYYYEDEISLIDLWLVLVRRKKLLIITFAAVVIIGLVLALITPKKYSYSTSIEIGSRVIQDKVQPIESPETLLAKIQESYIPFVQQQYRNEKSDNDALHRITARIPKGSQIIVLESNGGAERGDAYKELQQRVINEVQSDHKRILEVIRKELEIARNKAMDKLEELKDTVKLLEAREKRLTDIAVLIKRQIEEAKADLAIAEKNRQRSVKEATNEAKAMTLLMLDNEVQQQRQRLATLEERLIIEVAEGQDKLANEIATNVRLQEAQQEEISRVEIQLANLVETRALVPPMQSMEPTGLAKRVILAIAMVLGFVLALMAAFIAEFLQKAKEQIAQDESSGSEASV
ncbi:MAG: Wzz/FepE/Etk N-terminal domain-containing protein [Gammaproteobacteria bacterium]|nr:Wzz/FepE/Etk N-terminal domain-containing protein [Gammaproteobacteria bacterium]